MILLPYRILIGVLAAAAMGVCGADPVPLLPLTGEQQAAIKRVPVDLPAVEPENAAAEPARVRLPEIRREMLLYPVRVDAKGGQTEPRRRVDFRMISR